MGLCSCTKRRINDKQFFSLILLLLLDLQIHISYFNVIFFFLLRQTSVGQNFCFFLTAIPWGLQLCWMDSSLEVLKKNSLPGQIKLLTNPFTRGCGYKVLISLLTINQRSFSFLRVPLVLGFVFSSSKPNILIHALILAG